eukprot:6224310-Pyramimonas_sp.AAC.1
MPKLILGSVMRFDRVRGHTRDSLLQSLQKVILHVWLQPVVQLPHSFHYKSYTSSCDGSYDESCH